ncbi:MAG: MFS transporter [Novosphingobium sp.]|nr:MFS transporter [Novosphingobium sp.]
MTERKGGAFAPLAEPVFRRIWITSVLANFGQLILGVGAAWEMTRITASPQMVAMVQTALMLPLMLVAVPAGAIADIFDRRKIALVGLGFSMLCAAVLTMLSLGGLTTPWTLLAFCSLIGAGVALYSPAWQASISEQVGNENLPAAIALGTVSYNLARSFGPAVGGAIVLLAGAQAAFAMNAVGYLPLFLAFLVWRRTAAPSRLPPEQLHRAVISGARYAFHAAQIRVVLIRSFLFGLASASSSALAPLVAKDLLNGNAATFGILLGASGVGAVAGAFLVAPATARYGSQRLASFTTLGVGLGFAVASFSRSTPLTCAGLVLAGAASIMTIALMNVSVQLTAPRWVAARVLSLFSSALTGGIALGAVLWGMVAVHLSVDMALLASAGTLCVLALVSRFLPLAVASAEGAAPFELTNELEVDLALTHRSGPVVIEVDYNIDPDHAREFYMAMLDVQRSRLRNGAFDWSLSRDIANAAHWTDRYLCPTWGDYLRMRDRFTLADQAAHELARTLDRSKSLQIRRRLERPFGSVRWRANSPDPQQGAIGFIAP